MRLSVAAGLFRLGSMTAGAAAATRAHFARREDCAAQLVCWGERRPSGLRDFPWVPACAVSSHRALPLSLCSSWSASIRLQYTITPFHYMAAGPQPGHGQAGPQAQPKARDSRPQHTGPERKKEKPTPVARRALRGPLQARATGHTHWACLKSIPVWQPRARQVRPVLKDHVVYQDKTNMLFAVGLGWGWVGRHRSTRTHTREETTHRPARSHRGPHS